MLIRRMAPSVLPHRWRTEIYPAAEFPNIPAGPALLRRMRPATVLIAAAITVLFGDFTCPSSGNRRYSTRTLPALDARSICSDSPTGTLVSCRALDQQQRRPYGIHPGTAARAFVQQVLIGIGCPHFGRLPRRSTPHCGRTCSGRSIPQMLTPGGEQPWVECQRGQRQVAAVDQPAHAIRSRSAYLFRSGAARRRRHRLPRNASRDHRRA